MDVHEFIRKWAASKGAERSTAQEHFIDICRLLGEQTPNEADPGHTRYAFEKGAKTLDGDGWADVWLKGQFAWEYKGKKKDLTAAIRQVRNYSGALDNPPLLVACDLDRYEIHTNWNTETWIYRFDSAQLATQDPVEVATIAGRPARDAPEFSALDVLRALFRDPAKLRPERTRDQITRDAALLFGAISKDLRAHGTDDASVARFITKVVFCMFASDVGLLPRETFSEVLKVHTKSSDVAAFRHYLSQLFKVMNRGGKFQMRDIPQFNGEMFKDVEVPESLHGQNIHELERLDRLDWSAVEPSIFGTLFERILDWAGGRAPLGAHYTSREDIELIVKPVLMEPLSAEWNALRAEIAETVSKASPTRGVSEAARQRLRAKLLALGRKLSTIRVLDPACGSGNFLYVALAMLKELEQQVIAEAATLGVKIEPKVHPRQLYGIEVNPYARELASIVIWIGYLQWKQRNGLNLIAEIPILEPLHQIERRDAIVARADTTKPKEAAWPEADVIVGNPPFLGGKRLRTVLGDEYVDKMFAVYDGRVAREADLCVYWFEKARASIEQGKAGRAGLLATQAIRGGANRRVLERIKESGDIFYAQSDRPWILDGAAVRVSMVGFDDGSQEERKINEDTDGAAHGALLRAQLVPSINANLTARSDVTQARRLKENVGISFMGDTKVGPFDIDARTAQHLLQQPNPHGKPNSDVVRPWVNGLDIIRRPRNMWIVDFPPGISEQEAAKYEAPFEYIRQKVKPERVGNARKVYAARWWLHAEPRPEMRAALGGRERYLATARVSTYRVFVWVSERTLPDSRLIVFARADDFFFGVLQSRVHVAWALVTSSRHGVGNDPTYNNTTCFETFPMPHGTKEDHWAISLAAKDLNDLREGWLNPKPGDGLGIGWASLKKRTLTNLYNENPQWLQDAHRALDAAVFAAYGWRERPEDLRDAEIIARLLALNLQREPVD